MIFKLEKGIKFQWEGVNGIAYNTKDDFPNLSAAIIEVNGNYGKSMNKLSDRLFFVLEGKGIVTIENEKYFVEKNDCFIIEKNKGFDIDGNLKVFVVNSPAYNHAFEVREDDKKEGRKIKVLIEEDIF